MNSIFSHKPDISVSELNHRAFLARQVIRVTFGKPTTMFCARSLDVPEKAHRRLIELRPWHVLRNIVTILLNTAKFGRVAFP